MNTIIENPKTTSNRTIAGIIILLIGGALLIGQLDVPFIPDWLFSWPLILVAVGIYTGIKHNFRNTASFSLILLGSAFYLENTDLIMSDVIWPLAIMTTGVYMIARRSFHHDPEPLEHKS